MTTVCCFGAYDLAYPRNRMVRAGLAAAGFGVVEARAEGKRAWRRWPALAAAWSRVAKRTDLVLVPEFRHKDVPLARALKGARPLVFDRYTDNRSTGSFILIDPATNFTAGAGMITAAVHEHATAASARPSAAERLARIARGAATDAEAVEAVRLALEEILK